MQVFTHQQHKGILWISFLIFLIQGQCIIKPMIRLYYVWSYIETKNNICWFPYLPLRNYSKKFTRPLKLKIATGLVHSLKFLVLIMYVQTYNWSSRAQRQIKCNVKLSLYFQVRISATYARAFIEHFCSEIYIII